jgi:hypothetical protein
MLSSVVEKLPRLGIVQLSNMFVFSSYRAFHSVLHFNPLAISISTQLRQRNPQLLAEVSLKLASPRPDRVSTAGEGMLISSGIMRRENRVV